LGHASASTRIFIKSAGGLKDSRIQGFKWSVFKPLNPCPLKSLYWIDFTSFFGDIPYLFDQTYQQLILKSPPSPSLMVRNASLKRRPKLLRLTPPRAGLPKTLESGLIEILWVMHPIAESSSQSFSSWFGSIRGYRSKVFLSPACSGVESNVEMWQKSPASVTHYNGSPISLESNKGMAYIDMVNHHRLKPLAWGLMDSRGQGFK
jgi:hypothetical protein